MTPQRKGSFIRRVKDIAVSSTLSLAIFSGALSLQSCGNNQSSDYEEQEVAETVYRSGIKSYITEVSPGEFKITDEIVVPKDSSMAFVRYYDGHRDTLTTASAKALIDKQIQENTSLIGQNHSLANALLFGGMGYMLANTMGNKYLQSFRNSTVESQRYGTDTTRYRRHGHGSFFASYYLSRALFDRSQALHESVGRSKTTITKKVSRPVRGKSGFFGRLRSGFSG